MAGASIAVATISSPAILASMREAHASTERVTVQAFGTMPMTIAQSLYLRQARVLLGLLTPDSYGMARRRNDPNGRGERRRDAG
jgi:hypothetical protein